jgi:hypothetical protein
MTRRPVVADAYCRSALTQRRCLGSKTTLRRSRVIEACVRMPILDARASVELHPGAPVS